MISDGRIQEKTSFHKEKRKGQRLMDMDNRLALPEGKGEEGGR